MKHKFPVSLYFRLIFWFFRHFGSSIRSYRFNLLVALCEGYGRFVAPGFQGYGRCWPERFQTMSEAGSGGKQRSLRNVRKVDLIRHQINLFDSKDCMTQSGAAGVDEKIMKELQKRGDIKIMQMDPMKVCIHRKNRGSVIGNSQNLPILINVSYPSHGRSARTPFVFAWKKMTPPAKTPTASGVSRR